MFRLRARVPGAMATALRGHVLVGHAHPKRWAWHPPLYDGRFYVAVVMVSRQSAKVEGCGRNAERKRSPKGLPDVAICKNLTSKEHSHSNIDTFCRFPIIRSDFATLPAVAI